MQIAKFSVRSRPRQLGINCDSTRMSIIDVNGILTFFDCERRSSNGGGVTTSFQAMNAMGGEGEQLKFERKDVWDMVWAEDNPELFAMLEKTRMYIFKGMEPEEPVLSSGYLCQFRDLTIKAAMLDDIMASPDTSVKPSMIIEYETKTLRDARALLKDVSLSEAARFSR